MSAASIVTIEFVNMMSALGDLPAAARLLGYLDTTRLFDDDSYGFKAMVAGAAARIDADEHALRVRSDAAACRLDERGALTEVQRMLRDRPRGEINAG